MENTTGTVGALDPGQLSRIAKLVGTCALQRLRIGRFLGNKVGLECVESEGLRWKNQEDIALG